MCGRTAQTVGAVRTAASLLGISFLEDEEPADDHVVADEDTNEGAPQDNSNSNNNFNLSPGMDAWVFHKAVDATTNGTTTLQVSRKVWGLVPRPGTRTQPLAEHDMSRHFSNLMFNARSDDGILQPTFARLATAGKTCVVAVDGFFEWKLEQKQKQPYFVSSSDTTTVFLAGLWTSVATGRDDNSRLDTFTILTTAASPTLQWLHTRMPVRLTTMEEVRGWLDRQRLPRSTTTTTTDNWKWHAVTPAMSSLKFRSEQAIQPLPTMKTVASMFRAAAKKKATTSSSTKSSPVAVKKIAASPSPKKRPGETIKAKSKVKKTKVHAKPAGNATLDSFFQPKKPTITPSK